MMLDELGYGREAALRSAQISPIVVNDPAGIVSGLQELALQRAFMRITSDRPDAWLTLGSRYRLLSHAHTNYGLMMATAPSVEAALRLGLSYGDLYYMLAPAEGIFENRRLVGFRSLATEMPADLHRFSVLRDVAVNCAVTADLWGGRFPFDRIELPLPASDEPLVRSYLPDAELVFEARINCWRWSVRADLKPPPQSDSILHESYRRACDRLLAEAHDAGDVVDRLVELLSATHSQIGLEAAAQELGLSARTLQRRLNMRDLSYRDLVALKRHQAACRLLVETQASISRIAFEVGYDNVSSFNFAFRRHAGISPSKYRRGAVVA